jgi:hypothetical protein
MRRINTLNELKAERKRLSLRRVFLEEQIKKDFKELKQSFEPIRLLAKGAEKTLISQNNHLISDTAGQFAKFIARTTLRRSGFLSRLIVPYLVKNAASNFVENNKSKILSWVEVFFTRLSDKKSAKIEEN